MHVDKQTKQTKTHIDSSENCKNPFQNDEEIINKRSISIGIKHRVQQLQPKQ